MPHDRDALEKLRRKLQALKNLDTKNAEDEPNSLRKTDESTWSKLVQRIKQLRDTDDNRYPLY